MKHSSGLSCLSAFASVFLFLPTGSAFPVLSRMSTFTSVFLCRSHREHISGFVAYVDMCQCFFFKISMRPFEEDVGCVVGLHIFVL